jgi:hypothetical protein
LSRKSKRLFRLVIAQRDIEKLLEVKLVNANRIVLSNQILVEQISRAINDAQADRLIFHEVALKRLSEAEASLSRSRLEADALQLKLGAARSLEMNLSTRSSIARAEEERKLIEESILEAALLSFTTACGKVDVVK